MSKLKMLLLKLIMPINYYLLVFLMLVFSVIIGVLGFSDLMSLSFIISGFACMIDRFRSRILSNNTGRDYFVNIGLAVILISGLYFVLPYNVLIVFLFVIASFQIIISWTCKLNDSKIGDFSETNILDFCLFYLSILIFCFCTDYAYHSAVFTPGPTKSDHVFFSSLVVSLSNSDYFHSFFNDGAIINYQFFAFLFPSFLFDYTHLTANQSLYGVFMPFIEILGFFLLTKLISTDVQWRLKYICIFFIYVGFQSINPLNIFKLNYQGFNFLTSGHFLPGGNPPLTLGFVIALIGLLLLGSKCFEISRVNLVIFIFISTVLVLTKIAIWLPFFVFYSLLVFLNTVNEFSRLTRNIIFLLGVFLLEYFLYSCIYGNDHPYKLVYNNGEELFRYVNDLLSFNGTLGFIFSLIVIVLLNFGPRLIVFLMPRTLTKNLNVMILAAFLTILLMYLMYAFVGIDVFVGGVKVGDQSFDIEQFIRASFILFHMVSIIVIIELLKCENYPKRLISTVVLTASLIGICGFFALFYNAEYGTKTIDKAAGWRTSIRNLCLGTDNNICFLGESEDFTAWDLCSDNIGRWWFISNKRYVTSSKNYYRSLMVDNCYDDPKLVRQVIDEGVDMFILTPDVIKNNLLIVEMKKLGFVKYGKSDFVYVIANR